MFTPDDRARIREAILRRARADPRITGGAITGSASIGAEDRWSDIDLAFGLKDASDMQPALADYTRFMYDEHGAVDHLDVAANAWIYRVFLLRDTLQVDLAFAPRPSFGALAPTWRLVFGEAAQLSHGTPPKAEWLIGMAWLYGLHARSCIKRGERWQAEYMIHSMRDHVLHLACLRLGLPAREGRGFDKLPADVTAPLEKAFVGRIDETALVTAFRATVDALLSEARRANADTAGRIEAVMREVARNLGPRNRA